MKELLYSLYNHNTLSRDEACDILLNIGRQKYDPFQIASFMTVFQMRGITLDELGGFRDALLQTCTSLDLSEYGAVDIVGTGGDNKNTFNISTAASFVVAGAGYPVIKHGNYAATSVSGASNVLEYHGVKFAKDKDSIKRIIDGCGFAYLHAPLFHPIMKEVAPIRKALAVRTFFNMMGPLVNPGLPKRQLLGVYNLKMGRLYNYLFQQDGSDYCIVHSLDGYDEISLTGEFKVFNNTHEQILKTTDVGMVQNKESDLYGGETIKEAAGMFDSVLEVRSTQARKNTVIINAAYAIKTFEKDKSIDECIEIARDSIESKKAFNVFRKFVYLSSNL